MEPLGRFLAVHPRHILAALGIRALESDWRVRDVWATDGDSAGTLESFDGTQLISGPQLRTLSENVLQVIDGVFSGFEASSAEPWVVIEAVDSSFFLVSSGDARVLDIIRNTFREVSDYDQPVT
jgi:hypothetical protein